MLCLAKGERFRSVARLRSHGFHILAAGPGPDWLPRDFDAVRRHTRGLWEQAVAGVAIEGGSDAQKEAFVTALYHSFLDPRSFSDIDGHYTGPTAESTRPAILSIALFSAAGMCSPANIRS